MRARKPPRPCSQASAPGPRAEPRPSLSEELAIDCPPIERPAPGESGPPDQPPVLEPQPDARGGQRRPRHPLVTLLGWGALLVALGFAAVVLAKELKDDKIKDQKAKLLDIIKDLDKAPSAPAKP